MNDNSSDGFSLIELVVCVAVLAVLAVGAGLVASRSGQAALQSDSKRFEQHIRNARARAVQGRQTQGLFITPSHFNTAVQTVDGWETRGTQLQWRGKALLQLKTPRRDAGAPHIVLLPDGRITEFSLLFGTGSNRIKCSGDGVAAVTCG